MAPCEGFIGVLGSSRTLFYLTVQDRAAEFVNQIKSNPDVWRLCTERFSVTAYSEVKFWCLQTLHEVGIGQNRGLP